MISRFYVWFFMFNLQFPFFNVWKLTSISMYVYITIFIVDGYFISCKSTINKQ